MTFIETFVAILAEPLTAETAPYVVAILTTPIVAYVWGMKRRTLRQDRVMLASALLWLAIPVNAMVGAAFRYSGSSESRGVVFSEFGAMLSASVLPALALVAVVLLLLGRGIRINVTGVLVPLLLAQFWVALFSGCAIVGACV